MEWPLDENQSKRREERKSNSTLLEKCSEKSEIVSESFFEPNKISDSLSKFQSQTSQ